MALRAVFIGIDKHKDPGISELTGATKDATALWALFKDSVEDIDAERLLDDQATVESILRALDASLGIATEDDTVIVFFAGHGTPNHRLVPYDTDLSAVDQTTISMKGLSDRLKASSARATLIILDCCFSGAAPARVLEGLPAVRAGALAITDLGGNGRVVLAAARDDQAALEFGQHGLFTAAFLRVIQDGPGWTDIGVLMERSLAKSGRKRAAPVTSRRRCGPVSSKVVSKYRRYSRDRFLLPNSQTPRAFGLGSPITELSAFGVPQSVLNAWNTRFSNSMTCNSLRSTTTVCSTVDICWLWHRPRRARHLSEKWLRHVRSPMVARPCFCFPLKLSLTRSSRSSASCTAKALVYASYGALVTTLIRASRL